VGFRYAHAYAPSAAELAAWIRAGRPGAAAAAPPRRPPPPAAVACLALLPPAAAAAAVPAPLRALAAALDPADGDAGAVHGRGTDWNRVLDRLERAVAAVPRGGFTAAEAASLRIGVLRRHVHQPAANDPTEKGQGRVRRGKRPRSAQTGLTTRCAASPAAAIEARGPR
jgi:hypothetical protein